MQSVQLKGDVALRTMTSRSKIWERVTTSVSNAIVKRTRTQDALRYTLSMVSPSIRSTILLQLMEVKAPSSCGTKTQKVSTSHLKNSQLPSRQPTSLRTANYWLTQLVMTGVEVLKNNATSNSLIKSLFVPPMSKKKSSSHLDAPDEEQTLYKQSTITLK